ncbi:MULTISPECIES: type I DNA topoisomerase [Peptoniphilus]|uniref:type I DNA topoisomerase n=2 Tax=Peptoniphilaceae TaxID=1570339 RepID=UPI0008D9E5C3|nr:MULTISPECIES: type I DNA topoisomerase [Peptoniphilus]MDU1043860.1 type I DNA topoisomerase [Peptoniphilus rhinitidis]MDU1954647.1 type I DNA topoisomerase [Peptoniphilus lacydonensis]MDU2115795.1 type I DNA topoisomerase [Peptoniphilus lacydonensis]MDU3750752.1 type I DNA topoisomerase [Peptoniphilus rhinitidis]MDU5275206.1 type I DNA topoisomerase [Peptoniphilus lacydonensis]
MAKNLVIVESPTKAKTIKKMLGRNYNVIASVGHIRDLPKSKLGIDIENDFEPQYMNIYGKGSLIKDIKKEARKADNVILATDPDREGEAISWHLSHILEMDPEDKNRVTFNEITKDTVKREIKNPRKIDMDLVDAQQARRELDRLAGYKISPLLWKKVKAGLSAGRVQSAVLKLICDREDEINNFIPEEYWTIEADLRAGRKKLLADYYGIKENDKIKKVELKSEDDADKVIKNIDKEKFVVDSVKKGRRNRKSPNPFTTSTMQQESSRRINFSTRKTMMVAQSLYEGVKLPKEGSVGLITYMRTDSTRISLEAQDACLKFIEKDYGKEYLGKKKIASTKKSEKIQDAHECIRPTDVTKTPYSIKDSLSKDQFKLYSLIWKRFVASLMASAIYNTISADIISNNEVFRVSGSNMAFDGFLRVYDYNTEKSKELPSLEENQILKFKDVKKEQHFTNPPPRYNEASLIKELEDLGVGRPSTYSPTISTLQSRYYVVLEEKKFVPTELGVTVNEILVENFDDLVDKKFTAQMENELDEIAAGKKMWKELVRSFYKDLKEDLDKAYENIEKVEIEDPVTDVICDKCGRNMVIKMGRYGKFLACPGFPECRNTKPLVEKIGVKCPKCEDGEIVVKRSKKGRKFYGCDNYPKCDFVSWNKPIDEKCPKCGNILTEMNSKGKKIIKCSNNTCDYRREESE